MNELVCAVHLPVSSRRTDKVAEGKLDFLFWSNRDKAISISCDAVIACPARSETTSEFSERPARDIGTATRDSKLVFRP